MIKPFAQARDRHLGAAIVNAPTEQSLIKPWIQEIYEEYQPKAVVSTERLGAGADGNVHTATGLPLTGPKAKFEGCIDIGGVVTEANRRKIFSVGIGDHGNELGFGTIYNAVVKTMPKGKALATVVKTDVVIPAMMSNWGCYGIEACLAYLLKKPAAHPLAGNGEAHRPGLPRRGRTGGDVLHDRVHGRRPGRRDLDGLHAVPVQHRAQESRAGRCRPDALKPRSAACPSRPASIPVSSELSRRK